MSTVNNPPHYDAFINRPVSPLALAINMILTVLVASVVLWMVLAKIDIVASTSGTIIPIGKSKEIQAQGRGVVTQVYVVDGQIVTAGDVLIRLDPTEGETNRIVIMQQLETAQFDTYRLRSILDPDPERTFARYVGSDDERYSKHLQLIKDQVNAYRHQQQDLHHQKQEATADLAQARINVVMLTEIEPLLIEQFEAQQNLLDKGFTSKPKYLTAKQHMIETQNKLAAEKHHIDQAQASVLRLSARSKQIEAEYRGQIGYDLLEAENRVDQLLQELKNAERIEDYAVIVTPISGIIHEMTVTMPGVVVQAGQPLLKIIPSNLGLEVEAFILNKDIGFVEPGQSVIVKVASFPFTKYGSLDGIIMSVSQDALDAAPQSSPEGEAIDAQEMAAKMALATRGTLYKAHIAIDRTIMMINGRAVQLMPGMAVTADIKTGQRTIMDFLLSTLKRIPQEGMRER